MQSTRNIRRRAQDAGVWPQFKKRREALKRSGYEATGAWKQACVEILEPAEKALAEKIVGCDLPSGTPAEKLIERGRFLATEGAPRDVVQWVAANIAVLAPLVDDCPCPEAWALLSFARSSDDNEKTFWTMVYGKIMPTKAELNDTSERRDDGRAFDGLLDKIEATSRELQEAG